MVLAALDPVTKRDLITKIIVAGLVVFFAFVLMYDHSLFMRHVAYSVYRCASALTPTPSQPHSQLLLEQRPLAGRSSSSPLVMSIEYDTGGEGGDPPLADVVARISKAMRVYDLKAWWKEHCGHGGDARLPAGIRKRDLAILCASKGLRIDD